MSTFLERVRDLLEGLPAEHRVVRAPVPEHWLAELEAHHVFRFPEDYRALLVEIDVAPPLLSLVDTGILPGTEHPRASAGHSLTSDAGTFRRSRSGGWTSAPRPFGYYKPPSGALPICQLDRALRDYLIVTGSDRGTVWHDARADRNGWHPYVKADGGRVAFTEWYVSRLAEVARHGGVELPSPAEGGVALLPV